MFQISDLDTEDSKKDTMVDVVFKKALKEFRLNIFNSYSTALAVSRPNKSWYLISGQMKMDNVYFTYKVCFTKLKCFC